MIYVIPTIDVEGMHGRSPVNDLIWGVNGYGIPKIVEIFKMQGLTASFFVDVYERSVWGKEINKVIEFLLKNNQDIELHTHPAWEIDPRDCWNRELVMLKKTKVMFDPNRPWMHMYSLDEQVEILEKGKEILSEFGIDVIAHRSGGYSVDANTLQALAIVGIPVDMSIFSGHPNTFVNFENMNIFQIKTDVGTIIEVPVTRVYMEYSLLGIKLKSRIMKTDIDWISQKSLIKTLEYLKNYDDNKIIVYVLFMHSYSFLNMNSKISKIRRDKFDMFKLKKFLNYCLSKSWIKVVSIREFYETVIRNIKFENVPVIKAPTVQEEIYKKIFKYIYRKVVTLL